MLTQADFEQKIIDQLSSSDPEIVQRYQVGDPLVVQQIRANAAFFALMAREVEVSVNEPFIKSRDSSIIADATNKGILPIATACRAMLQVINNNATAITLDQGRFVEDHAGGRLWRLNASANVAAGAIGEVEVEQCEYRSILHTVAATEDFYHVEIEAKDDLMLAGIRVRDVASNTTYSQNARWMNVAAGAESYTLTTDSFRRIFVEFGADGRAGRTVTTGQQFEIAVKECYGEVDIARLKDASLVEVNTAAETKISVRFKEGGVIANGTNPLSVAQLRVLASYPSLYDENAVFLSNFDYSVRKKFMAKLDFLAVWNETEHESYYAPSYDNVNHLHLCVKAKATVNQAVLESDIQAYIGQLDSLFMGRVITSVVLEKPIIVKIDVRLAAPHDAASVESQIRTLLIGRYGRGQLASSRWIPYGFNAQEVASYLRKNVVAFQDMVSDFSIELPSVASKAYRNKPHWWVFMDDAYITIKTTKTVETGVVWTF